MISDDKDTKCPHCKEALKELEEIDDDLESAGYIEVVKTDDRKVARELGIHTFPALVYFRRKNPILYDGKACLDKTFFLLNDSQETTQNAVFVALPSLLLF